MRGMPVFRKPLFVLCFAVGTGLFAGIPAEAAPKKPVQQFGIEMMQPAQPMQLTSRSLLESYKDQRAELVRNKTRVVSPNLFKNKLKILNEKIDFLEKMIQKQSRSALSKPTAKPQSVQKVTALKNPVPKPAPRRVVSKTPVAAKAVLLKPAPVSKPVAAPARLLAPSPRTIAPVVKPAASAATLGSRPYAGSGRLAPVRATVLKRLPLLGAASRTSRASAFEIPVEPKAVQAPPAISETTAGNAGAMGRDWLAMSDDYKMLNILSMMGHFLKNDLVIWRSQSFYVEAMDKRLAKDPSLADKSLEELFLSLVYENEPEERPDIDKIRRARVP
jgi:hypothetical protein